MTLDAGFDRAKMENLKIRGLLPLTLAILNYSFNFKVLKSTSQIIRMTVIHTIQQDLIRAEDVTFRGGTISYTLCFK